MENFLDVATLGTDKSLLCQIEIFNIEVDTDGAMISHFKLIH